ncbi:hypothetical protein F5883DRAFT_669366 [Diaporthe sp. PMI_573]|nr:hypothetical protein F5883DRAFT_669366 [Diaporthaceae sp. PMI_573]
MLAVISLPVSSSPQAPSPNMYDVLGPTPAELRNISSQHRKLEDEIEELEEKLLRLRKQKRFWSDKMKRAVRRGLDNLDELDRLEREEAEVERQRIAKQSAEVVRRGSPDASGGMQLIGVRW